MRAPPTHVHFVCCFFIRRRLRQCPTRVCGTCIHFVCRIRASVTCVYFVCCLFVRRRLRQCPTRACGTRHMCSLCLLFVCLSDEGSGNAQPGRVGHERETVLQRERDTSVGHRMLRPAAHGQRRRFEVRF